MHDPKLTYIYMCKDSLLHCMHEAAAKHGIPSISSNSLQCQTNFVLILLNQCGVVGVGLGASLEGENQIWLQKIISFYFATPPEGSPAVAHAMKAPPPPLPMGWGVLSKLESRRCVSGPIRASAGFPREGMCWRGWTVCRVWLPCR